MASESKLFDPRVVQILIVTHFVRGRTVFGLGDIYEVVLYLSMMETQLSALYLCILGWMNRFGLRIVPVRVHGTMGHNMASPTAC